MERNTEDFSYRSDWVVSGPGLDQLPMLEKGSRWDTDRALFNKQLHIKCINVADLYLDITYSIYILYQVSFRFGKLVTAQHRLFLGPNWRRAIVYPNPNHDFTWYSEIKLIQGIYYKKLVQQFLSYLIDISLLDSSQIGSILLSIMRSVALSINMNHNSMWYPGRLHRNKQSSTAYTN